MIATSKDSQKKQKNSSFQRLKSTEAFENVKSLLKLKQQEKMLEKELNVLIDGMKIDPMINCVEISRHRDDLLGERQTFVDNLKKNLGDVSIELKSVKSIFNDVKNFQKVVDTKDYKEKLIKLSNKIKNIEDTCSLYSSPTEEQRIQIDSQIEESNLILQKYKDLNKLTRQTTRTIFPNRIKNDKESPNYQEIHNFHSLVAKTGHTQKWSNEDHSLFLKSREKCTSVPNMISLIQKKCPDLSIEMIVDHEAWYKIYLELREKQKTIVEKWRKMKELEKTKKYQEEETKRENNTRQNDNQKSKSLSKFDKKELIKRWRNERDMKRFRDDEEIQRQLELKRLRDDRLRRARTYRIKGILNEYKREKEKKSNGIDEQEKCIRNEVLIRAYREKDKEFTENKRNLIMSKLQKTCSYNSIVDHNKRALNDLKYSPSTLINSTIGWDAKIRANRNSNQLLKLQYIKDLPNMYGYRRNEESMKSKY